jgi:hypothetical protein
MILHYNVANCNRKHLSQPQIKQYLSDDFENLFEKYKKFAVERIFPFIDRTGQIPNYLNTKIYTPMPEYDNSFNSTFEELCELRIRELLDKGKKLNLFWSGGLDSTTLLSLFFEHRDKIRIHLNYNSILEGGYIYDTFIKNNFEHTVGTTTALNQWYEDELYITGDPGNHLHTIPSINSYENFIPGINLFDKENVHHLHLPYERYVPQDKIEFYEPALKKAPRPIETLEDFIWFNTFNFRFDESRFAMVIKLSNRWNRHDSKMFDSIIGFFYTDYFQQWSINNKEPQYDLYNFKKTIKLQMRKIISKRLGPKADNYVRNKSIVESPIGLYHGNYMMLTDNLEIIKHD